MGPCESGSTAVEAHLNVSGRELARATVEPMADEMVQLDALKKMLRGVK